MNVGTYTKVYVYAQLQNANVKRIYVCRQGGYMLYDICKLVGGLEEMRKRTVFNSCNFFKSMTEHSSFRYFDFDNSVPIIYYILKEVFKFCAAGLPQVKG